jgi:hypothetical protein
MTSLLMKIHQVHDCLNIICDVESDIFDSSFKGLFRKKDYAGNEGVLQTTATKLTQIHDSLKTYQSGNSGIDMVIEDLKNYSYALALSTIQLILINKQLGEKANGKPYSMGDYNRDVNMFRELQDNYMSFGAKLNADYKLYSYEIANLDD